MPWKPRGEGDFPTLGWVLLDWWADFLPSPRDPAKPLIFTDEQARILLRWYELDPKTGRYLHRRGASRRSKGWGKSPVEGAKCIAELAGPVRFDGWDADGQPVGRPWGLNDDPEAWVQIGAVSEDQTENTHSVVYWMLTVNDGRAADDLKIDAGLTRSYLRDGNHRGKLEPVTAAAGSREGQPITYGCLDETHLWTPRNGGKKLAATIRRNVGKMGGRTYETTNAFDPGDDSVAQATDKAAVSGAAGVFYDAVEAPRFDFPAATDAELKAALKVAYGDAWWVDLDRIVADIRDPDMTTEDAQRFHLNWNVKSAERAINPAEWADRKTSEERKLPAPGAHIGLGFDGSISGDATALIGCTADGLVFELGVWERPEKVEVWRVPRREVKQTVAEVFDTYRVGLMLCDPPRWQDEIEGWQEAFGDVVEVLDTNQAHKFAPACERFATAVTEGSLSHDGSEVLTAHVLAMGRRKVRLRDEDDDGRTRFVFVKSDTRKIDAGVAATLAYEAAARMPQLVSARAAFVSLDDFLEE